MKGILYILVAILVSSCENVKKERVENNFIDPYFKQVKAPSVIATSLGDKGFDLSVTTGDNGIIYLLSHGSRDFNKTIEFTHRDNKITYLRLCYLDFVSNGSKGRDFFSSVTPFIFKYNPAELNKWIFKYWDTNKKDTINSLSVEIVSKERAHILTVIPLKDEK